MPSPFPGMDPYLESQGFWRDFHASFLIFCRIALRAVLPKHYTALIDERISLVDLSAEAQPDYRPDVAIARENHGRPSAGDRGVLATLEPVTVPLAIEELDEIRLRWIEIRRLPDLSLVTVIEILSPTNKSGSGRIEYVEKRNQLIRQPVNLVEIDLLLGGQRPLMGAPLPPADYFTFISRHDRRPNCDVFAWSIRQVLPVIPIPLSDSDPDVNLNLGAVFSQTFDLGPYSELIKYAAPLDLPLTPEDRAWAEALGRAHAQPPSIET
jgi:hypothetical protein